MPTLTITRNYVDLAVLTKAQLDAANDSIETFFNTTKIDNDNIQAGGVIAASIGTGAVTTVKLDSAAVTTAKITDANVTTAKIADLNVTRAKMVAVGEQLSSSSGAFTTTSTSFGDITNLSVTITTTGRPVSISVVAVGGASVSTIRATSAVGGAGSQFKILRDSTSIAILAMDISGGDPNITISFPSVISHTDVVVAGTYVYKLQAKSNLVSTSTRFDNWKLLVYEL